MERIKKVIACRFCDEIGRLGKNLTILYYRTQDMSIYDGQIILLKAMNGRGYNVMVVNPDVTYQWATRSLEAVRVVRNGKTAWELAEEAAKKPVPKKVKKREQQEPQQAVQLPLY